MQSPFLAAVALAAVAVTTTPFSLCAQEQRDAVSVGKRVFESIGCATCHAVAASDDAVRTGPSLYGLFVDEPRDRGVQVRGKPKVVKADRAYFVRSLRKSWDQLAIAESGERKGEAYPAVMPVYVKELLSDEQLDALWHYLRTCADEVQRGPASVMVRAPAAAAQAKNPLAIPGEELVVDRTRVLRAPLAGTSARALHVGQPNGMSFSFDPRMLSVRRVWTGGFLNLQQERSGRGRELSKVSDGAQLYVDGPAVLAPLAMDGTRLDFEFKEPDAHDEDAIERHLWDPRDFATKLAETDAEFLGYGVDATTGTPTFRFRVGENRFAETVTIDDAGRIEITLDAQLRTQQRFRVRGLPKAEVSAGTIGAGVWTLAPSVGDVRATLSAPLRGGVVARALPKQLPSRKPQPLQRAAAKPGKRELEIPAGYTVEDWQPPRDALGREQLFEPTGIAVASDGTIVVATRAAGVWRIRDNAWSQFAEGTYEALGVCIEDEVGDVVVIAQKPELTRLRDVDGDGRADDYETVCDDYGFHGNYHEYTHGPVRDADGSYYFLLNLAHGSDERVSWRAGGNFMGSMGGYRGFACRVTQDGVFEPFAMGLRSPAGFGIDPNGRLWYAENQGEYVGSSKWVPLEQGKFYGHPAGLVSLPGMTPYSEELAFERWRDKIQKGAVWLPHGKVANSPGNPAWDQTDGKFGAFGGHAFVGDQTLSQLLRVVTETVDGKDQGCVVPFARGLQSGIMRPCFLPDGSLLLGQTGRGWGARGGSRAALQRLVYDGKTVAADILDVRSSGAGEPAGFTVRFTQPLAVGIDAAALSKRLHVRSWFYKNTRRYGSPEHDRRDDGIAALAVDASRRSVRFELSGKEEAATWSDRVYRIWIDEADGLFGDAPSWSTLEAFYTRR
ncbi:MAG: c-type cytochrome [Planctomycetota bacterium]